MTNPDNLPKCYAGVTCYRCRQYLVIARAAGQHITDENGEPVRELGVVRAGHQLVYNNHWRGPLCEAI